MERWAHELVASTGMGENSEVHPEPEHVYDSGHDDEAESPGEEVLGDVFLTEGGRLRDGQSGSIRACLPKLLLPASRATSPHTHHAVAPADVQDVPQIDEDGRAYGEEHEEADHLAAYVEGQEDTGGDEPGPPFRCELAVA